MNRNSNTNTNSNTNIDKPDRKLPFKCVLVTGGCGFIGSNFLNSMIQGYPETRWINLDKLDYVAREHNITDENRRAPNYLFFKGDLLDEYLLLKLLNMEKVDAVVHFAAQSHVDNSFGNSVDFTQNNVLGTHKLLEACRIYGIHIAGATGSQGIKRFIHISTDEVYGEVPEGECNECAILDPTNPYAASKAAAEFIVKGYYHSFGMPVIITRGNNVYGPRQYPEKVIPAFIDQLRRGQRCKVQGSGECKRNFIYVDDTVHAIEMVLLKGRVDMQSGFVEVYNIGAGPECEYSVLDIARLLVARLCPVGHDEHDHEHEHEHHEHEHEHTEEGWKEKWIEWVPDRKFNDIRYSINSDKLQALGWRQQISFQEGFERTVQWYLDNPDHFT